MEHLLSSRSGYATQDHTRNHTTNYGASTHPAGLVVGGLSAGGEGGGVPVAVETGALCVGDEAGESGEGGTFPDPAGVPWEPRDMAWTVSTALAR